MKLTGTQRNVFITLFAIGLMANLEKGMIGLIAPYLQNHEYMSRLGLQTFSATQVGMIASLFYLSFILMTFFAGWFVDKFGYRIFVPVCLGILTAGTAFFGVMGYNATAAIFVLIPVARLVIGFGQAGYTNGAPPIIAKLFDAESRGSVQGKIVSTAGIGTILVYLVFPLVVTKDFRWVYFGMSALFLVCLFLFLALVPSETAEQKATQGAKGKDVKLTEAWTNRNTLVLAATLMLNNLVGVAMLTWLGSMYKAQFGAELRATPMAFTIIMVGYGVSLLIATFTGADIIKNRFPGKEKPFMLACTVIGSVFLVGSVMIPNLWGSAVSMMLANLFIMWAFSALLILPYRLIPLRIIGSAFAVINIGAFVGGFFQGYGVGAIVDATGGYLTAFIVLAVILVLSGLVPYLLKEVDPAALNPQPAAAAEGDSEKAPVAVK